ncbi:hypothetical protein BDY24DRAFT_381580 [Mrakia frigida]|uniref:uncharacterized protein n=1 Tax=Mrakia frigida TaxID=29902 RepID=UPI003FCC0BB3
MLWVEVWMLWRVGVFLPPRVGIPVLRLTLDLLFNSSLLSSRESQLEFKEVGVSFRCSPFASSGTDPKLLV